MIYVFIYVNAYRVFALHLMPFVVFSFACFLNHRSLSVLWASLSNVTSLSHGCTCVRFTMRVAVCLSVCICTTAFDTVIVVRFKIGAVSAMSLPLKFMHKSYNYNNKIIHLCFALHFRLVSQFDILCDFLLDSG